MIPSATARGNSSPDLTFDHPDQSNSVERVLQYGSEAVQNQTDGTVLMQRKKGSYES